MYYIYQHIRLDKNEVFYIGIGQRKDREKDYGCIYKRAFSFGKKDRNPLWRNIYNKTQIKVEIIEDYLTKEYAYNREKELIEKYGRICLKSGVLSNITEGGDDRSMRKIKTIHCYDYNGVYIKTYNYGIELKNDGFKLGLIYDVLKGISTHHKKHRFSYEKVDMLAPLIKDKVFTDKHKASLKRSWLDRKKQENYKHPCLGRKLTEKHKLILSERMKQNNPNKLGKPPQLSDKAKQQIKDRMNSDKNPGLLARKVFLVIEENEAKVIKGWNNLKEYINYKFSASKLRTELLSGNINFNKYTVRLNETAT